MINPQEVYVPDEDHSENDVEVYPAYSNKYKIDNLKNVVAIVLSPEQYKEGMVKFAEYVSGFEVTILQTNRYLQNLEPYTTSELFDKYQEEVNTPKEK